MAYTTYGSEPVGHGPSWFIWLPCYSYISSLIRLQLPNLFFFFVFFLSAREHSLPDQNREQGEDNRLRPGPRIRPPEGPTGSLWNAGIHGTGSSAVRTDRLRDGHVERRSDMLRFVSRTLPGLHQLEPITSLVALGVT